MTDTKSSGLDVFAFPGSESAANALARNLQAPLHPITVHRFPDEEALVTLPDRHDADTAVIVCSLDRPDAKLAALLFAADQARCQGINRLGLVAPYLAYMRQDKRFHAGEAISSRTFASVLSHHFDFLVTVDPHLHRYSTLDEVFTIPSSVVSAAPAVAEWIAAKVERPLLIGPDSESAQWIEATAKLIDAPSCVLQKTRRGDADVSVSIPDIAAYRCHTPVLLDDIISTGRTMAAAVRQLVGAGGPAPVCIGVHAIFADDAYRMLCASGGGATVTCNTIVHVSNEIDVMPLVAAAIRALEQDQS
ncbi:MAG: ribose-phosphate pyrophosphokinase [Burkholderiales bacterium]|nr:ribose-phosphate pyrophosphokinase [Burkholderiales bacterium]